MQIHSFLQNVELWGMRWPSLVYVKGQEPFDRYRSVNLFRVSEGSLFKTGDHIMIKEAKARFRDSVTPAGLATFLAPIPLDMLGGTSSSGETGHWTGNWWDSDTSSDTDAMDY